jgi:hypothetical protein
MASRKEDGNKREKTRKKQWNYDRTEEPVFLVKYEAHDGRWFRSGRVVFDSLEERITIRLPWRVAWGKWGFRVHVPHWRESFMALRKIDQAIDAAASKSATVAEATQWPQLLEYLTASVYPDGSRRQQSSLVALCDGPLWRCCLSDRDNGRVLWKSGATLVDALEAIELSLLGDDPSEWRRSSDAGREKKKRS